VIVHSSSVCGTQVPETPAANISRNFFSGETRVPVSIVNARESASRSTVFTKLGLLAILTTLSFFVLSIGRAPVSSNGIRIHLPLSIALRKIDLKPHSPSAFEQELAMGPKALIDRWQPFIEEASQRFNLPVSWIRAVVQRESGGRTMMAEATPITSRVGALGIMQVMPQTYDQMRAQYDLGADPNNPHDNVIAGTAYLQWLYKRYGFPQMFAAYNDGPGNFDRHLSGARDLPPETVAYLAQMTDGLSEPRARTRKRLVREARVSGVDPSRG
jgi:hypothetical protein